MSSVSDDVTVAQLGEVTWRDAPIRPDWIVSGAPRARCADLSLSTDGLAVTAAWDCSAGTFRWHNNVDETVHILEGGVTVTDAAGVTRSLRPGDVALFRRGTTFTWHVPQYVRKLAFLRHPVPRPAAATLQAAARLRGGIARRLSGRARA